jgi:hypothetical protein
VQIIFWRTVVAQVGISHILGQHQAQLFFGVLNLLDCGGRVECCKQAGRVALEHIVDAVPKGLALMDRQSHFMDRLNSSGQCAWF